MACWALLCYLDFTFSAQGWGSSYGVALAVPLALWTSFFFFFFSGLRHYQKKKKINSPKEHWNQSQIIWNAWPVQRKKRILNPNLSICLTHHRIAYQNVFFAKTNSDQVNARAKTRDQEDIDHSDPQNTFWDIKLHLTYFVVKLSK